MRKALILIACFSILLSACQYQFFIKQTAPPLEEEILSSDSSSEIQNDQGRSLPPTQPEDQQNSDPEDTITVTPTPPSNESQPSSDGSPLVLNPLTGLPINDTECLNSPPAVISITNFPASARPQAGLDFASVVFEAWIGQGDTRFLGVFYCDFPREVEEANGNSSLVEDATIGPIRSGRIWFEDIRQLMNGFIVMASAWSGVAKNLSDYANIFGSDEGNINSAMIDVSKLEDIAKATQKRLGKFDLSGNVFDENPPAGGVLGESVWIRYALLNQVFWRYNTAQGAYNRYNNDTKTGADFTEAVDRLNNNPLTYENVVIMFADHHAMDVGYIDIDFVGVTRPALLFRDGKMYEIQWTTMNGKYERETGKRRPPRFIDKEGNPFPLKPGQTWVMVVPSYTRYYETIDSENIIQMLNNEQPGSGHWAVVFRAPVVQK